MKYAGIDIGAETIKYAIYDTKTEKIDTFDTIVHHKAMQTAISSILSTLKRLDVDGIAVCGRFANLIKLKNYPAQAVQKRGLAYLYGDKPITCISIGCNGFSVLEKRPNGADLMRENSRCSQGTGNFLRQLIERFGYTLPQADALCDDIDTPCQMSGRCPVILKTDMTHLANRGEPQPNIIAGVYDAICDNVQALIKPVLCPKDVVLTGGVTRSKRIRNNFKSYCQNHDLHLLESNDFSQFYIDAAGCALLASEFGADEISLDTQNLIKRDNIKRFDAVPPLKNYLSKVKRCDPPKERSHISSDTEVYLGFDIGSTGSKAVAIVADASDNPLDDIVWQDYLRTNGNPVKAAQQLVEHFLQSPARYGRVVAFGVTGSGREIVGSMLSSCFGAQNVYIINEIAAHAEGARAVDPNVDTIFEIGGQDAKYIRLSEGRIVDAAMNEACSAGTGSFIEEQGRKFREAQSLTDLSDLALSADHGVSLGQHCSVFMAQVIEEAIASGVSTPEILAGIYDSVVLNYFYRVKGNRSVGHTVFCQGMPFQSPALAAAVVRQTQAEVIIPPNPGNIGAFGIARLARKAIHNTATCNLNDFLAAKLSSRHTFVCASNKGCGGSGNKCRIDKIVVDLDGKKLQFTWGGACSLWDKGISIKKLPNFTPDPFAERKQAVDDLVAALPKRGNPTIAISEEFQLKTFFPFFSSFLYECGFDIVAFSGGTLGDLHKGLDESNVRFCAPMQHYHGVASKMAASSCKYLFWPMMRCGKSAANEETSAICPIVQSSPDLLRHDLGIKHGRILSPVIDLGTGNLESLEFAASCRSLAQTLGVDDARFSRAFKAAKKTQEQFDRQLIETGRRALAFAAQHSLPTVIVLGRNYTIHNNALNSNVPALLKAQGAMAIPVDCYPIDDDEPIYTNVYWSYGQLNLRAATQIRKTPHQYAIWCSNYGCGPDSFNLHFFQFIMQGKPYTIIETDGHSGDAGTKTRIEAFLHCIAEYEALPFSTDYNDLHTLEQCNTPIRDARKQNATILIPPMSDNAEICAAGFRNIGVKCMMLPRPTRKTLQIGRRHTSGKECLPALITLGSLLEYVQNADPNEKIVFFMPRSNGPCRLGCYNLLDKIVLKQLKLDDRVKTWSLCDTDYSEGVPLLTFIAIYTGFIACDTLMAGLYDVRPVETKKGAADEIYRKAHAELVECLENLPHPSLSIPYAAKEILTGSLFGMTKVIQRAAQAFARIKSDRQIPTVCVTGEIYVRNDPFANDDIIDAMEKRGVRVLFAHFSEWIEYADIINREILKTSHNMAGVAISEFVRHIIRSIHAPMQKALHWQSRHDVHHILDDAAKYLRKDLVGEEILTIGTPLHAYKQGEVQGVVSVMPLECMPGKVAESQFYHIAENEGLLAINLAFNGDPLPESVLDDFCFEVKQRFERQNLRKTQHIS